MIINGGQTAWALGGGGVHRECKLDEGLTTHDTLLCTALTSPPSWRLAGGQGWLQWPPRGDDQGDKDRKRKSTFCTEFLYSRSLSHVSDSLAPFVFLLSGSGESDLGIRFRLRIRKQ